jgi:sugar lactone lactonase YvrE
VIRAEQVTTPVAEHGEGPVWWPDGHLRFVDLLAGDLLDLRANGQVDRTHVATVAAAVRPRADGGAVVAAERGLVLLSADGHVTRLPEVWSDSSVRMNDGGCDPQGRFYCGSMAYDAASGRGRFYRFAADGSAEVVFDRVTISNGFAFAPSGDTAYYVDTPTQRIDVLDYDPDRGLSRRRPFAEIHLDEGCPDGIAVDSAGGVWVACWGAGAVRRFAPDGSLDAVVQVPGAAQVSACTLGGPDLDHLFITTSRVGLDPAEAGQGGAVFVVRDVVPGQPVQPVRM